MNNIYLATTALEETWDTNAEEILFLGKHCAMYPKRVFYSNKYSYVPTFWNNQDKIENAAEYCNKVYEDKLVEITEIYNNIFNIKKNTLFYRTIFGYWLMDFIHNVYDKYSTIVNAYNQYSNLYSTTIDKTNYFVPINYMEYVTNSTDDYYSLQIYSQIIKSLELPSIQSTINIKNNCKKFSTNKNIKQTSVFYKINKFFKRKQIIITNPYFRKESKLREVLFFIKSRFQVIFDDINDIQLENQPSNHAARDKLKENLSKTNDPFLNTLNELISLNIPMAYLEYFDYLYKLSKNDFRQNAHIYFTSNAHYFNEYYKYLIAQRNYYSKLLIGQHGGGYGYFKLNDAEKWEVNISDKFYTFGYKYNNKTKFLYPSIFNEPLKYKYNSNKKILYVTNTKSRYLRQFNGFGFFGDTAEEFFTNKRISFLKYLKKEIDIVIRFYVTDVYKLFEKDRIIESKIKNISIDNNPDFFDSLNNCKLHITDITMTTFLHAMRLNIPTICFSLPLKYNIRKEAEPFFQKLLDAKILFFSEKDAATHLNSIYTNIDKWWYSQVVQEARKTFCTQYANKGTNLIKEWLLEFEEVLTESHN